MPLYQYLLYKINIKQEPKTFKTNEHTTFLFLLFNCACIGKQFCISLNTLWSIYTYYITGSDANFVLYTLGSSLYVISKETNSYSLKEAHFINPTTTLNTSEIDVSSTSKLTNTIDQRSHKVHFPKSEDIVVLGGNTVLIITQDKGVKELDLSEFHCYHPTTLVCSVDQESPRVYIGCQDYSVVIAIYVMNGEYNMEIVASVENDGLVSPAFVVHNGQIQVIQFTSGGLWRANLRKSTTPLYPINSNVVASFGECTTTWDLLTYNSTHFIIECKGTKQRYLVKGDGEDERLIPSSGYLWILIGLDMAVDLTATHFTFYQNGFLSNCSVALSSPVIRIDYAIINGKVILVLLGSSIVMVYDTTKGCSDQYLEVLANGTFPCFSGSCDGYYIFDNQYILIVSIVSGLYHISTYDLKSVALLEYHFNFFNAPLLLYVITPSPVEDGSGFITDTSTTSTTFLATSPVTSNLMTMTQSIEVPYTTFSGEISTSPIPTLSTSVTRRSPIPSSTPTLTTTNIFHLKVSFGIAATVFVIICIFCCVLVTIVLVIIIVRKRKRPKDKTDNSELQHFSPATPPPDNQAQLTLSSFPSSLTSSQPDIQGITTTTHESPIIDVDCFDLPPGQQELVNGPDCPGFGVNPSSNPYTDRPDDKTNSTTTFFDIVKIGRTTLDDRMLHVNV